MIRLQLPKFVRFWTMIVIAVTVVIAPAAAEIHVDLGAEATCESAAEHDGSEAPDEDTSEHKKHHAHHCGGCHIHVMNPNTGGCGISQYAVMLGSSLTDLGPGLPEADGPFRPPRS